MFEHQHSHFETQSRSLASIDQCCSGVADELASFRASAEPALSRRDGAQGKKIRLELGERAREQLRFDANRVLAAVQGQERLLLQHCAPKNVTIDFTTSTTASTTTTAAKTTIPTTPTTTNPTTTRPTSSMSPVEDDEKERLVRSCLDLLLAGSRKSGVYSLPASKSSSSSSSSSSQVLCDQDTDGGGWTVNAASLTLSLSLVARWLI